MKNEKWDSTEMAPLLSAATEDRGGTRWEYYFYRVPEEKGGESNKPRSGSSTPRALGLPATARVWPSGSGSRFQPPTLHRLDQRRERKVQPARAFCFPAAVLAVVRDTVRSARAGRL